MTNAVTEEFDDTKEGKYKRWNAELTAARAAFRKWHKEAEKTVKKFLDDQTQEQDEWGELTTRLNLFHSNITTMMSMLYGKIPRVEVARRFADADDPTARVAGEMLTRILNIDIEAAGEDMASVFRNGLQDRLIPGCGNARVRYACETETHEVEAIVDDEGNELAPGYDFEKKTDEWVDFVYTHWKDILWSPARTHCEIRWKAYRSYMDKKEFKKRFPKAKLDKVNFSSKGAVMRQRGDKNQDEFFPQAEVWEVWDKDTKYVCWYTEGYGEILDEIDDPLNLEGFFPDPPPFIANVTTSRYMPRADFSLAKDLYRDIDKLQTRISLLTDACKLIGIYDKQNGALQRIFTEGIENDLIPVDNWAMFAEKGGLKGTVDWIPIEMVANVIQVLTEKQGEKIQQLYQVTGMNDIMRGAAMSSDRTSATRDQLEASYGSIRIEALQNEFARWVGDLQELKVEIIQKFYDDQTIIEQSNIMSTEDGQNPQLVEQAIDLIKDERKACWKITVRPETLAIADYAQLKQDRTEYINALAMFMQSAAPLLEMDPSSLPTLLKLLKWGLAGFRGSTEIEGVIDQAIARLTKQPPQPKPDPNAAKIQAEMQQSQQEAQQKMQQSQQEFQQKIQENHDRHQQAMQQNQQEFAMRIQEMQQEFNMNMKQVFADLSANIRQEAEKYRYGTLGAASEAAIQMESDDHAARRDSSQQS